MTLDLLHNKIIKETLTESFEKSVNDNLVPKLQALYGASLEGVQLYEDYINDSFVKDGYWYYPLTVVIGGIHAVVWIKWDISVSADFKNGNPYAYVGNGGIDFIFADDVPIAFKNALEGRSTYFEGGCVKMNVATDAPDPEMLSGKYSQTFVDEMNRQISAAISRACGIKGLAESSIELDIVFAPNTYMEHTSENVTYRRLLISAKGCSARDFWIKWTRKNSSVAYSVNDNVASDDIVFELGEDVSQKIREKEYRFLVYGNSDKYRVAMGRKNVTEWRELIKRALKRGELTKTMDELEESAHVAEVSDKLSEILEKCGVSVPVSTSSDIRVDAEMANEALRLAVLGNGDKETENYVPEGFEEPETTDTAETVISENIPEEITLNQEVSAEPEKTENIFVQEDMFAIDELPAAESVFDNMPDDEFGEFELTRLSGRFDAPEESTEAVEELSFEDILEEFIPKSDESHEEEPEAAPVTEIVDISDIAESEALHYDIYKNDDEVSVESDPELEIEIYEDTTADTVETIDEVVDFADEISDTNDENAVTTDEDVEVELVVEEAADKTDDEEAILDTEENDVEIEILVEAGEDDTASDDGYEDKTVDEAYVNAYDEINEIKQTTSYVVEESVPTADNETVSRLENEIEELKLQLEIEKKEKDNLAYKLDEAIFEKEKLEAELEIEKDGRADVEAKLRSATIARENAEGQVSLELLAAQDLRAQNEKQKFAIEEVKKIAEAEAVARRNAESEVEMLRAQIEGLKADNAHLKEVARVAEEACRNAEQMCKQHERELMNQIELTEKERTREKELFAEAARQVKEENEQRFAEMREAEIARIEEEARIEALRRAEENRLKLEDELRLSGASQYSTFDAEQLRKKELEERAKEARLRMEEKARQRANASSGYTAATEETYATVDTVETAPTPAPVQSAAPVVDPISEMVMDSVTVAEPTPAPVVNYTYTSYIVRLMFRRNADPNVTARIHEMISYALTEFGKDHIYMKVKASMPDNCTVVLNFVKFPEEEFDLLVKIINYLGKSDLGVYKVVLD